MAWRAANIATKGLDLSSTLDTFFIKDFNTEFNLCCSQGWRMAYAIFSVVYKRYRINIPVALFIY